MRERPGHRLVVISPARNEVGYIARAIDAVLGQTLQPLAWVIVDDGSTDRTSDTVRAYMRDHDWISLVTKDDRGARAVGRGVVDAFLSGYEKVAHLDFDYVCKLDVDIVLPPGYFEAVISRMTAEPRLGTASGKPYYVSSAGSRVSERIGDDISVGAVKMYKRRCLEQIGGLVRDVMWDGIDCHRARIAGWTACSWSDEDLMFEHLRPMGSSERGIIRGRVRWGRGQYFMGTGPTWMMASAVYRMITRPLLLGGLAMMYGYLSSAAHRAPRLTDPDLRVFLRKYHRLAMVKGKEHAREEIERTYADRWDPLAPPKWTTTLPKVS